MEELGGMTAELRHLFAAKEERRKELARLPFPKKVEAVVKLQEMAAAILRTRGKMVHVWQIDQVSE